MPEPLEGEVCRRENHPLCMTPECPCYSEPSARIFVVTPKTDDPKELETAALAQKLVDSPTFIAAHKRAMDLAAKHIAGKMMRGEPVTMGELTAAVTHELRR